MFSLRSWEEAEAVVTMVAFFHWPRCIHGLKCKWLPSVMGEMTFVFAFQLTWSKEFQTSVLTRNQCRVAGSTALHGHMDIVEPCSLQGCVFQTGKEWRDGDLHWSGDKFPFLDSRTQAKTVTNKRSKLLLPILHSYPKKIRAWLCTHACTCAHSLVYIVYW